MNSYHYHLKFELYPSPDPEAPSPPGGASGDADRNIWIPADGAALFSNLPSHPRSRATAKSAASAVWGGVRPRQHTREFAVEDYIPPEDRRHISSTQQAAALSGSRVVDCGTSRPSAPPNLSLSGTIHHAAAGAGDQQRQQERPLQWRARSSSFPPPGFDAGLGPKTAARDWRFGKVNIESFDMAEALPPKSGAAASQAASPAGGDSGGESLITPAASLGPTLGGAGQATRARFTPLENKNTAVGWGIVHLYREGGGTGGGVDGAHATGEDGKAKCSGTGDDDGTILCVPAVPSYLSPSEFVGFVGETWRGDVSHYRMVMTSRTNRYMVLLKFRDPERAREWRNEFDGKVFNSLEAEICHVTFIKSITVETPRKQPLARFQDPSGSVSNSLRPFPPPTADLVELPTCPVCLERMDDTTGLMTILCQHVFHCTCLQTWKGSGCPVCRATNPSLLGSASSTTDNGPYQSSSSAAATGTSSGGQHPEPFGAGVSNLCRVCDEAEDLWICLICGNVGCGRYRGGHAKDHWKETAHSFSLELETQHVWDYAGDMWVHRLIREKGEGKVVELPAGSVGATPRSRNNLDGIAPQRGKGNGGGWDERVGGTEGQHQNYDEDVVPRAKLDRIGLEYTHLLTSQLESQRVYFEELVSKAADKAAKAGAAAEAAGSAASDALRQLSEVRAAHAALEREVIPSLERDVDRERRRADKAAELAREKVGEGLMERIGHINGELEGLRREVEQLKVDKAELEEMNRDLTMFISGQEKLRQLENEGKVEAGELEAGSASVPATAEERRKAKGKGRAKK
ncbi:RING finger protein [Magnaporthiopsis poae ATCC 64411]|uniref:RING finger protein n=1 Tax=Magnaporthiopsis poae (strain ATCC 64411 / 73-15) TaxID=644358 RepID=A0A0C4DZA4_MAGP6|nr:RING finger protein [Magnaporthiopsis poae ATCC 64411]